LLVVVSCAPAQSLDDYHDKGQGICRDMIAELQQIRTRDDLLLHTLQLETLFNSLVLITVQAQEFKTTHPDDSLSERLKNEHAVSDQLCSELNRVMKIEGGREVIIKAQEKALNHLDSTSNQAK